MKIDEKKINHQFFQTLIIYIAVLIVFITGAVLVLIFYPTDGMKYVIIFFEMLVLIFISGIFKSKMDRLTNISYLVKIFSNPGAPLPLSNARYIDKFARKLTDEGFTRFSMDFKHALYYKVNKDFIKKTFSRYMLEVVVVINDVNEPFYLDIVDEEISKIQQEQLKNKVRFDKMLITQVKEILEMNDTTKQAIKEIVFVKTKYSVVSTINVGLHQASSQAIMMYSNDYSPSLYYSYHIDQIKKML